MNKPIATAELKPAVTTGPLPSSRKIFVTPDEAPDVQVPLREIILSEGAGEPNLAVYDTSGPYTDPNVTIDVNKGLPRNRTAWVLERGRVILLALDACANFDGMGSMDPVRIVIELVGVPGVEIVRA